MLKLIVLLSMCTIQAYASILHNDAGESDFLELYNERNHRELRECPCGFRDFPAMNTLIYDHPKKAAYKDAKLAISQAENGERIMLRVTRPAVILSRTSLTVIDETCTGCTLYEISGLRRRKQRTVLLRCCPGSKVCAFYDRQPKCNKEVQGPPPTPPPMPRPMAFCADKDPVTGGPTTAQCNKPVICSNAQEGGGVDENSCKGNELCFFNECPDAPVPKYCGMVGRKGELLFCDWKTECTDDASVCPHGTKCMESECSPMV